MLLALILSEEEALQLSYVLADYHDIFSILDDKQGDKILKIDTGDTSPKKQVARRISFATQQEIVGQLE